MNPPATNPGPPLDRIETWVFDLDNTLYRVSARMHAEIDRKIVSAESTSTTVYFAPGAAGTFTLKAEHLDFFPASISLVSTGAGGLTPARPGQEGICGPHCPDPWTTGCQAWPSHGALPWAALLMLGLLRRKHS